MTGLVPALDGEKRDLVSAWECLWNLHHWMLWADLGWHRVALGGTIALGTVWMLPWYPRWEVGWWMLLEITLFDSLCNAVFSRTGPAPKALLAACSCAQPCWRQHHMASRAAGYWKSILIAREDNGQTVQRYVLGSKSVKYIYQRKIGPAQSVWYTFKFQEIYYMFISVLLYVYIYNYLMLFIYFVYLDTTSSTSLNLYKGLKLLEVTATGEAPPTSFSIPIHVLITGWPFFPTTHLLLTLSTSSIFIVFWGSPTSFWT